jgi:hypothetical protein
MSGPKVVKIVTKEEVISICEGHLRRLDQAIAQWAKEGKKIDQLTDDEISATLRRRDELTTLLAQEAFMEVQKRVPEEIAYLKSDANRREQIAIEAEAQRRKRGRQAQENAASLLIALQTRKTIIPDDLLQNLKTVADGGSTDYADTILGKGFNLLVPHAKEGLTDEQKTLAFRLNEGNVSTSFTDWKDRQVKSDAYIDSLLERIDRQIAEANMLLGEEDALLFVQRLNAIQSRDNQSHRNLLLDSLILDLAKSIEMARTRRAVQQQLDELATEIQSCEGEEFISLRKLIAECDTVTTISMLTLLTDQCREALAQQIQRNAAQARREVVLQGLARLGYEINEGMETAWAKNGSVVLRKPTLPDYGVELGGQAETSRMQIRAVAFSENRDINRDKDIETIWCGEFSRLQQLIDQAGGNLSIERALSIGQIPLKYIDHSPQIENATTVGLSIRR